ncbi:MAG: KUP/HAK/KT family potassium transporter [Novosphingobium sp.]
MPRRGLGSARELGALGVVFGDIGTSPLYAVGLLFAHQLAAPTQEEVLGGISLILWTLTLIVALKYALLVLRADNDGEGGVFALYGLLDRFNRKGRAPLAWALLLGAGLLFGDGIITPAISVLSAVEGLSVAAPRLSGFVIPVTLALLTGLFWIQHRGTRAVGHVFGPVMLIWFSALAVMGTVQIAQHPEILSALSPVHAVHLLTHGDLSSNLLVLGAVILVVTGGEAMYADMGHFGAVPIRHAWFAVTFPALILSYLGQGAYLLAMPAHAGPGLLFHLVPSGLLLPFIVLATMATIIASQALISGTFSLISQAIALGFFPQLLIRHTHHGQAGEVYIPFINWLLFIGCAGLIVGFGSSSALGSAYGFAVSGNMLTTSVAMYFVARKLWTWNALRAAIVFVPLVLIDGSFVAANSAKFLEGGYVPLAVALVMFGMMLVWHWGRAKTLWAYLSRRSMLMSEVLQLHRTSDRFIEQTAVLMIPAHNCAKRTRRAPALLQLLWERNRALPRNIIFVHVAQPKMPFIHDDRFDTTILEENSNGRIVRVEMQFGFMEIPDVEDGLKHLAEKAEISLEADHRKWNVHVVREHLAPARSMSALRVVRFRAYELLRLISQPTYYHYGLGYDVPLSVEILPVHFS